MSYSIMPSKLDLQTIESLMQLNFIDKQPESIRKACTVFWDHHSTQLNLDLDNYQELIDIFRKFPYLPDTILALHQANTWNIEDLYQLVKHPKEHFKQTILHHFAKQFTVWNLNPDLLKEFNEEELEELITAMEILATPAYDTRENWKLILENSYKGKMLRLFLPSRESIGLIDILFKGIRMGIAVQGREVNALPKDDHYDLAKKLHESFICATQLHNLNFAKEVLNFAIHKHQPNAHCFRQIILKVEAECAKVQHRLAISEGEKMREWQRVEKVYRETLYRIAYEELHHPSADLQTKIDLAAKDVLKTVDPDYANWMQATLIVIANILISLLSFGIANVVKYRNTGNQWFFTQTESGEKLRQMDKELVTLIHNV